VLETLAADDALSPLTANNLASLLLEEEGREAEALEIAKRFEGTENPYFADTLAWAYYKNGEIEKAAPLSRKAAAGVPDNVEILYHRGMIALAEGDTSSAESALNEAKRLAGTNSQVSPEKIDAALERL
jgi:tetratricopeptide (TPR) repeat protein